MKNKMKCCMENCNRIGKLDKKGIRYFPRGFCNFHYKKWSKENRDIIEKDKIEVTCCSVDNCNKPKPYIKRLCNLHYQRFSKNGDVNALKKRREGQTKHILYDTYNGMKKRCLSTSNKDYKFYGGKGITIDNRWLGVDGFFNFISDMGERPENHTLDRINSSGNYSPENCRWSDINTQNINRDYSKHKGVSYYKNQKMYRARIAVDGIGHSLGWFDNLEEAVQARKQGEIKYLGYNI